MKLQDFFCSKEDGTYIVTLSKKENERTDLRVECTYKEIGNKRYNLKLFIGVQTYELMFMYSEKVIDSIYTRLKDNVKRFILSEINENTKEKLNKYIEEKVIPKPDYLCEPIGNIYKIDSPSGKKYWACIYLDKIEVREFGDKNIYTVCGRYKIEDVVSIIKEKELLKIN